VRASQLINKTNQFNLTTRRYTQVQVAGFSRSPNHWLRWFRLRDRFTDHGLIAILLAARLDHAIWSVDSWLMSCRVIGRGVEEFMFNQLVVAAVREGARTILAQYILTPKNGLVKDLLPRLGFAPGSTEGAFRLELASAKLFPCVGLHEADKAGL
jgi:FkbH-like protein